mmetsp:Transcript_46158/g.100046  ORF Transcript_46158/g.100046 Transcript_46158/m.100046 type:complete len:232 (-) Transcript_46158:928-1623(-)
MQRPASFIFSATCVADKDEAQPMIKKENRTKPHPTTPCQNRKKRYLGCILLSPSRFWLRFMISGTSVIGPAMAKCRSRRSLFQRDLPRAELCCWLRGPVEERGAVCMWAGDCWNSSSSSSGLESLSLLESLSAATTIFCRANWYRTGWGMTRKEPNRHALTRTMATSILRNTMSATATASRNWPRQQKKKVRVTMSWLSSARPCTALPKLTMTGKAICAEFSRRKAAWREL